MLKNLILNSNVVFCLLQLVGDLCLLNVLSVITTGYLQSTVDDHNFAVDKAGISGADPKHLHGDIYGFLDLVNKLTVFAISCVT